MNLMLNTMELNVPKRSSTSDDPLDILQYAIASFKNGGATLATLVDIRGGAARALGSHLAIAADGSFVGYVSGGCVEAAVASEALLAMEAGRDRTVYFGDGSPFFDVVLPCGGGIMIAIHILRDVDVENLEAVVTAVRERRTAGLSYSPTQETINSIAPPLRCGWGNGSFETVYRPRIRVVISGQSSEAVALERIAEAAGHNVVVLGGSGGDLHPSVLDQHTAVVLLHHDLDAEERTLGMALQSSAFYIGALGSTRTHRSRVERLRLAGFVDGQIDRIKAPIGMFGPTKDSTSLALSILADVAASRLAAYA